MNDLWVCSVHSSVLVYHTLHLTHCCCYSFHTGKIIYSSLDGSFPFTDSSGRRHLFTPVEMITGITMQCVLFLSGTLFCWCCSISTFCESDDVDIGEGSPCLLSSRASSCPSTSFKTKEETEQGAWMTGLCWGDVIKGLCLSGLHPFWCLAHATAALVNWIVRKADSGTQGSTKTEAPNQ